MKERRPPEKQLIVEKTVPIVTVKPRVEQVGGPAKEEQQR
jgi:hypothetical protein